MKSVEIDSKATGVKSQESSAPKSSNYTLSPEGSRTLGNEISGPPVTKAVRSYQQVGPGREPQHSRRSGFIAEADEANGYLHQPDLDDTTVGQNTGSAILQSFPTSTFDAAASNSPFIAESLERELDLGWMIAKTQDPHQLHFVKSPIIYRKTTKLRLIIKIIITSYYVDEFGEVSKLFHEQRFSRIRRLPGVFADIFEGARNWEPSERRGLGEEVLKETEAVVMLENSEAWQSLQSITDAAMAKDNISTEQVYQNLSTVLPMELDAQSLDVINGPCSMRLSGMAARLFWHSSGNYFTIAFNGSDTKS
ncbi:hypothetical protein FBULB1_13656 [Fusarium bulbicola]|nr:hypothetical protein FBULB1_13656 [Fusarium bulbicola]